MNIPGLGDYQQMRTCTWWREILKNTFLKLSEGLPRLGIIVNMRQHALDSFPVPRNTQVVTPYLLPRDTA